MLPTAATTVIDCIPMPSGHRPVTVGHVFWFFGLSGAGKTTLTAAVARRFRDAGRPVLQLDGDMLRTGVCRDLGFSDQGRTENIRRAAEVARLAAEQGQLVFAALITPRENMRRLAQEIIGPDRLSLIWVDTPLETCRQRDPKGLYLRAAAGQVPLLTGVGSPFETPTHYNLRVKGGDFSSDELVGQLMEFCAQRLKT